MNVPAEEHPTPHLPDDGSYARGKIIQDPARRYEIGGEVGSGGMGVIRLIYDKDIRRYVAMKVMTYEGEPTPGQLERFIEEAQIMGQLEHPAIVPIHELGVTGAGEAYFTMKMVRGMTLRDMSLEDFTFSELMGTFLKICDAIAFAHAKGVIHRDIKPGNIMVGEYGEVLVMDWGLAKTRGAKDALDEVVTTIRSGDDATKTLEGSVAGTPAYIPPEQAKGRTRDIDERSDIYALGAVLYEMLTLRPPFAGEDSAEMLAKAIRGNPEPPVTAAPDRHVPRELSAVCMKAMKYSRQDRYQTVKEFSADIRLFLEGRAVSAKEDTFAEAVVKMVRRNKQVSVAIAVAALLLVAVGAVSVYNIREERDRAVAAGEAEAEQKERAEYALYVSTIALAQENALDGSLAQAKDLLSLCPPRLRGWEWGRVKREMHQEFLSLDVGGGAVEGTAFSPDGTLVASGGSAGIVRIWHADTGREKAALKGHAGKVFGVAFSPDGKRLASGGFDHTVRIWDVETGRQLAAYDALGMSVHYLAFSPDGRKLAVAQGKGGKMLDSQTGKELWEFKGTFSVAFSPDGRTLALTNQAGEVKLCDGESGKERAMLKEYGRAVYSAVYSPDGKVIAIGGGDGSVVFCDAKTRRRIGRMKVASRAVHRVSFHPDGARVAAASGEDAIGIWDVRTEESITVLRGHGDEVTWVAYNRDGSRLVSSSADGTVKIWDPAAGQDTRVLRGHDTWVPSVAYSPDGTRLASAGSQDRTIRIWDARTGAQLRVLEGHQDHVNSVSFSRDGGRIASASGDRTVRIWDLRTGGELRALTGHEGFVLFVSYSPDGTRLASAGRDGSIRIWDAAGGAELLKLPGHANGTVSLDFSPDGTRLVSGGDDSAVRVWDTTTGRQVWAREELEDFVHAVAYSRDGAFVTAAVKERIRSWDTVDWRPYVTMRGHGGRVYGLALNPDGTRLASASKDGTVKIWDTATGRELLTLEGHIHRVLSVAFSPDGTTLASSSADKTIRIWLTDTVPLSRAAAPVPGVLRNW